MRMNINKIKWLTVSVSTLSLLLVFWVWPAWNSGSQRWYFGNDSVTDGLGIISESTMYRNQHPPSGHNSDFEFTSSFGRLFSANEAAMTMLDFGNNEWQYNIEWYYTGGAGTVSSSVSSSVSLGWELYIGRLRNSMFDSFHYASGTSTGPGSMADPIIISGSTMSSCTSLSFEPGDVLATRLSLNSMTEMTMNGDATLNGGVFHVVLDNTCYITSPLSDPGYPGAAAKKVPTLSQWGMLLFAVIIAFLSLFAIRRRVRMGMH